MEPAALLADRSGLDDELGDGRQVAQLDQLGSHAEVPVVLVDLLAQHVDAVLRARESAVAAHDADVVPHEAADLVPVLGDDDRFVDRRGVAVSPGGNVAGGLDRPTRDRLVRRRVREDERLEQRVRGQAVGAVQAGRGDFAGREQVGQVALAVEFVRTPPQQ